MTTRYHEWTVANSSKYAYQVALEENNSCFVYLFEETADCKCDRSKVCKVRDDFIFSSISQVN